MDADITVFEMVDHRNQREILVQVQVIKGEATLGVDLTDLKTGTVYRGATNLFAGEGD